MNDRVYVKGSIASTLKASLGEASAQKVVSKVSNVAILRKEIAELEAEIAELEVWIATKRDRRAECVGELDAMAPAPSMEPMADFEFEDHYVGFTLMTTDTTGEELEYEIIEDLRSEIYGAVRVEGLPEVLDEWHAWRDIGAFYVGSPDTCMLIFETLEHLKTPGFSLYLGFPKDLYYLEEDPLIASERWT